MPSEEEQEDEEDEVWIEKSLWQELDIPPKTIISEGPASDSNKDSSNKDSEQMKESE